MTNIPTLFIKEKWYNEVISGRKKYEYRIGKDFYRKLNRRMIWLACNTRRSLIYVKSILNNQTIPPISYSELLNIYTSKKIEKYGIIVLEMKVI